MGVKFDDHIQGLWLLNTLPDSWENLLLSLKTSTPNGIVTMEYVKSKSNSMVIDIGDVRLEMDNGSSILLRDVKHIFDIHLNLISMSRFDDEGYCNTFSDDQWKLTRGAMVVAQGKKLSTLYILQARLSKYIINAMEDDFTAFVHIPRDERSKLDMKTRQCIFIGYGLDEFDYKLYNPVEKKPVRSRDVVFMEDQTIQDVEKQRK
ncbi:hypothetical protein Patl1_23435 [Pistacia atlantica]|uniref:Uncharacterized protein n=1 Tax=Pistacia atlantica TaxID=434234 RepID=A0ACC1A027_9ROSI|nr:hypothetical protein Patl1_23435 [Pistacia atlantica]